ncbi:MAG: anhydro-N-acetylmuramic acid kinase [Candidatus Eisenbacteria bacterium]
MNSVIARNEVTKQSQSRRKPFIACGIMSGTSRDGIDVAIVEIGGRYPRNRIRHIHSEDYQYPGSVRELLMKEPEELALQDVAGMRFMLGRLFGEKALQTINHAGLKPADIDCIGSHGQTLLHLPSGAKLGWRTVSSTLQVGSGAVIAQVTGITTVTDFRSADIAVGGEGAPLVPVYDYATLRSSKKSRIALNIGGIANLTGVARGASPKDIVAFDTGPGNCMIDIAVSLLTGGEVGFDRDGEMAHRGEPDVQELKRLLEHSYFRRKPPKSTGWEEFGVPFTKSVLERMLSRGLSHSTIISTLTEFTCESIARAIRGHVAPLMSVDEIIVTGGGSRNSVLMEGLKTRLPESEVMTGEALGIPSLTREACAFAYLGYLCLKRIPANIVSQSHGLAPAILGSIHPT